MKTSNDLVPMLSLDDAVTERSTHLRAIEFLAKKTDTPADQITRIYEDELAKLQVGARVTEFLPVLTIRKVRGRLR